MLTIKNFSSYKLPQPYAAHKNDIAAAIKSLYSKDNEVKNIVDSFINAVNLQLVKKGESKDSEQPQEDTFGNGYKKSKRLKILENSLKKKEKNFAEKLQNHFNDVKSANGQPLNDKGIKGRRTLDRWDKQNESLKTLEKGIQKTKDAIEKEKDKIIDSQLAKNEFPQEINDLLDKGVLTQWRKHPNRFFVKGVDKARIIWYPKKKQVGYSYLNSIPNQEQYYIFRDVYNGLNQTVNKRAAGMNASSNLSCSQASKELAKKGTSRAGKVMNGCKNPISEEEYKKRNKKVAKNYSGVKTMKLSDIKTDPARFQNRDKLNAAIVKNIVDNFKATDLDPLVIWKDPKDDKFYLLAGHHRHAALKKLGRKTAPVKVANNDYPTEKDAIRYARELSNANRSLETPLERAKIYRSKIAKGISNKELQKVAEIEGKNRPYILNLAYLNPKGKTIEALQRFSETTDKDSTKEVEKQADWIGAARQRFDKLTNAHENELFDFLNDPSSSKRMNSKSAFLQYINSIAGGFDFEPSKPLNVKRFKYKSEGESDYERKVNELKDRINKEQSNIDYIKSRFRDPSNAEYIDTSTAHYDDIKKIADDKIAEYNAAIKSLQKDLTTLYQSKSTYLNAGANQLGMFGNVTPVTSCFKNNQIHGMNGHVYDLSLIQGNQGMNFIPVTDNAGFSTSQSPPVNGARSSGGDNSNNTRAKGLRDKGPANPLMRINGATSQFLGRLEIKPKGSIIIALDAKQGAGKTTAGWKFMNDVAAGGNRVLFASLEESPSSNLFQEKIDQYIDPQNVPRISVVEDFKDYADFKKLVSEADYIFIDSWQKLDKMLPKVDMDHDIRQAFNGKIFLIIFQQTTTGRTKGGADKVFDADVVIKGYPGESFDQNYFIADKNRYTHGDISKIAYNVAGHYVFDPTDEDNEDLEPAPDPSNFVTVYG